jgi:hypothetical protein
MNPELSLADAARATSHEDLSLVGAQSDEVMKDRLERLRGDVPGQGNTVRGPYERVTFPEECSVESDLMKE